MRSDDIVCSRFFPGYGLEPGIRSRLEGLKFPVSRKKFPVCEARESGFNFLIYLMSFGRFGSPAGIFAEFPFFGYRELWKAS
jgi:hypothetical protein